MNFPIKITKELLQVLFHFIGAPCFYINEKGNECYTVLTSGLLNKLSDSSNIPKSVNYLTLYLKEFSSLSDEEFNLFLDKISEKLELDSLEDFEEKIKKDIDGLFYLMSIHFDVFDLIKKGLAKSQSSQEYKDITKIDIV